MLLPLGDGRIFVRNISSAIPYPFGSVELTCDKLTD